MGRSLRFTAEFFHRGYIYKDPITIYEVANGQATRIRYNPDLFTFGKVTPPSGDIGFAGFRLHYPLNRADYNDEVCAFLGASYFRAVAKAPGLRAFRARPGDQDCRSRRRGVSAVPHVLAGAARQGQRRNRGTRTARQPKRDRGVRFTIRPGQETVFDTEAVLYPRVDIAAAGIAPLTSMFMFDSNDRTRVDDYREAVHDSGGLLLWTGKRRTRVAARSPIRRRCRSAPSPIPACAASASCNASDSSPITRTWRRATRPAPRSGSSRSATGGNGVVELSGDPEQQRGQRQHGRVLAAA